MANKLLLSISANGATAACWRGGRLRDCAVFPGDEAGIAAFREYAAPFRRLPAFMLVDAVEEDYRLETLPHAGGSDRAQMVERKLKQFYRGSPYCAATLIGRDSSKRRDDRFLFSALTNPEFVAPWLTALIDTGLPIGGIHLLPMVMPRMLDRLDGKTGNLLLVAAHPAGLRLTFFKDGLFRLSRLSRGIAINAADNRPIIDEVSNTRLYLHALRAATLDESVNVVFIDHADQFSQTAPAVGAENPGLNCSSLGRDEIARRLRLDPALIALSSATIYLQLLAAGTPANNLASPAVTAGYRRYHARRQVFAASALAAAVGIAWTGYNLWQQFELDREITAVTERTARVNADYQAATRQFPAAPTTADNLKRVTELADRLAQATASPERFYQVIGRALALSPEIAATELSWQHRSGEPDSGPGAAPAPSRPPAAPGSSGPPPRRQSGVISGQVVDFKGDFRKSVVAINTLAERLRSDPAVDSVRVLQLPLNASSTSALTGNTADNPAQSGAAEFKLAVLLKQPS